MIPGAAWPPRPFRRPAGAITRSWYSVGGPTPRPGVARNLSRHSFSKRTDPELTLPNIPPQPPVPLLRAVLAAVLLVVAAPGVLRSRQLAYIDPGSGSFLIQIAIATVLGGAVMARLWFSRIIGIFRRTRPGDDEPEPTDDVESG